MEALLKSRRVLKGKVTRIQTQVSQQSTKPLTPFMVNKFLEQLTSLTNESDLLHKAFNEEVTDEEYDEHEAEYSELTCKIEALQDKLQQLTSTSASRPSTPLSVYGPSASQVSVGSSAASHVKLPKLELPTFDGNLYEWSSFYDLFNATVNSNPTLTGAQKLQYLKSSLRGQAAQLLLSIQVTDANYDDAWKIVIARFQNKREIVYAHLKRLCTQPTLTTDDPVALRKLIDTTTECVRALSILGIAVNTWDAILTHLITEKLDPDSRRQWELSQTTDEIPEFSTFLKYLENRGRALSACGKQAHHNEKTKAAGKVPQNSGKPQQRNSQASVHLTTAKAPCSICKGTHTFFKCQQFLSASIDERKRLVQKNNLCVNCLSSTHAISECKSGNCRKCGSRHHTFLHNDSTSRDIPSSSGQSALVATHASNQHISHTHVLLATALLEVFDRTGKRHICRALLDSGAQSSFISESCAQRLQLQRSRSFLSVTGLGETNNQARGTVNFKIASIVNPSFTLNVNALVLNRLTSDLPNVPLKSEQWKHLVTLKLADPSFATPSKVDILLGADIFTDVLLDGRKIGPPGTPVALETHLGWILTGKVLMEPQESSPQVFHCLNVDDTMHRFWELEEVPVHKHLTTDEATCENHFATSVTRADNGRYIVKLPFKSSAVEGASRDQAIRRYKLLEKRLTHQPEVSRDYNSFLEEFFRLGHMERVPTESIHSPAAVYLPHHPVFKETSSTTKLRVVFDASAKSYQGTSLNDHLLIGPQLQDGLFQVLMRFRSNVIAFSADIAKMYRQVLVHPDDTDFQRIVWRPSPEQPILDYRLLTVTYGTASAPFLATRCLQQLASDEEADFPRAAAVTKRDFYIDDLMSGAESTEDALEIQSQLIALMNRGGFQLRKWASNDPKLLASLPPELIESQTPLQIGSENSVNALGLIWHPTGDYFKFRMVEFHHRQEETKRTFLSDLAKLFDPLGWLSPVSISMKILFQQLWLTSCGWDDQLPDNIRLRWETFRNQLQALDSIKVGRCITERNATNFQLHAFCDASERAYSAVVYLRSVSPDNSIKVSLLAAKTRVAPTKQISLPRLELCGALLLAQLVDAIKTSLSLKIDDIRAWTDSTVTLAWISAPPTKWSTFVANRVAQIQEIIPPNQWSHVPGIENPADCASRGILPSELETHPLWWHGPPWLNSEHLQERNNSTIWTADAAKLEERRTALASTTQPSDPLMKKFSSWDKLSRVTTYIFRFVHNLTNPAKITGPLSTEELGKAQRHWIRIAQRAEFSLELDALASNQELPNKSRLKQLSPLLDITFLLTASISSITSGMGTQKPGLSRDWSSQSERAPHRPGPRASMVANRGLSIRLNSRDTGRKVVERFLRRTSLPFNEEDDPDAQQGSECQNQDINTVVIYGFIAFDSHRFVELKKEPIQTHGDIFFIIIFG